MTARTELGRPTAARDVQSATEHLVNVAHGKGDVVESALAIRGLQQERLVVSRHRATTQKVPGIGVVVGNGDATSIFVERGCVKTAPRSSR